ncbi:hypothetical protein [Larkinella soli]|uniref:hypothetical protein n=1 Tax=Larkinella soli TaxID=1770527 RepID=UPI000FFB7E9C|nr:hypothetical protein [Larkinella soli]
MREDIFERKLIALIPLFLVVVLIGLYGYYSEKYIYRKLKPSLLYTLDEKLKYPLKNQGIHKPSAAYVQGDSISHRMTSATIVSQRFNGRLIWVFSVAVNTFICVCISFVILFLLYVDSSDRKRFLVKSAGIAGVSAGVGVVLYYFYGGHLYLIEEIISQSIAHRSKEFNFSNIMESMRLVNSFTYGVALAVILTVTIFIWPRQWVNKEYAFQLKATNEQIRYLRLFLYCATALLIAGVLRQSATLTWTYAYIPHGARDLSVPAKEFGKVFTAVIGGFHTLVLAALYLPAAYILDEKRRIIIVRGFREPERSALLKEQNNPSFFSSTLPRILAVLGPILAGPVSDILKGILGS